MTEYELERMISLADDRYIEEAFEQKIKTAKKLPALLPFAAAAAVVCGLFFAARHQEIIIDDMIATEVTNITTVTELDEYNENLRYWKYFDGDKETALPRGTHPDLIYSKVFIPNDYTEEIVNFDFGYKPSGAVIYMDENGVPNNLTFSINAGKTKEGFEKTALFGINNAYEITEKEEHFTPEILNGVEIYGYETEEDLCADFIMNEQMYSIDFSNIGYKEAVEIIEMIIESKLTIESFDTTKSFKRSGMTIEQLFEVEPFGKYVPRKSQISDMPLMKGDTNGLTDYVETKVDDEIVSKTMYMWYSDQLGENTGKEILLKYCQYNYELIYFNEKNEPIPLSDLDMNKMMEYADTWKKPDEINSFDFRVDCGNCVIDIKATCTEEELWECLTSIMREATNQMTSSYVLYLASPVEGEISVPYGHLQSNFHKGIDFRADEGTPVYAAASGTVIVPVDADTGDGKNVTINHYTNINTFYAHLSKVVVNEGDEVKQGDIIGYVGSTGESTGPHLHFELCIDGEYVDPIDYFSDQAKADIAMQNELGMHELLESEFSQIHLPNQPTQN